MRRHNLCFWLTLFCFGMAAWSGWRWYSGSETAAFAFAVNLICAGICWRFAIKVRAINQRLAMLNEQIEQLRQTGLHR